MTDEPSYPRDYKEPLHEKLASTTLFHDGTLNFEELAEIVNWFFDEYVHRSWEKKNFIGQLKDWWRNGALSLERQMERLNNKTNCPRDLIEEFDKQSALSRFEKHDYDFVSIIEQFEKQELISAKRRNLLEDEFAAYLKYGGFLDEMRLTFSGLAGVVESLGDAAEEINGEGAGQKRNIERSDKKRSIITDRDQNVIHVDFKKD